MTRELHEMITELLKEGAPYYERQEDLATELGVDSPTISKVKFYKPEWEAHFQFFLKLIPIALKYDLIGARDLLPEDTYGRARNLGNGKTSKTSTGSRK